MKALPPVLIGLSFLGPALAVVSPIMVEWARHESPDVLFSVDVQKPVVALSIDDGPSSATPEILDVLRDQEVHATFFLIGSHVVARPELARRMVAEGHELGHHMMEDRPSIAMTPKAFRESFVEMDGILRGLGGSTLFRPGSGWYSRRMVDEAARRGYRTVLGSVYPFDAQLPFPAFASFYIREGVEPGAVLILHDGPRRGLRTAEVLRQVLPELKSRGYRVVPVSRLLDEEAREGVEGR